MAGLPPCIRCGVRVAPKPTKRQRIREKRRCYRPAAFAHALRGPTHDLALTLGQAFQVQPRRKAGGQDLHQVGQRSGHQPARDPGIARGDGDDSPCATPSGEAVVNPAAP